MTRLALALTALLCCLPAAKADLSPRKDPPLLDKDLPPSLAKPLPADVAQAFYPPERDDEFLITPRTEVTVDGRPCKYADVPGKARIVKMELAADGKTVLAVHFRTKK